MDIYVARQPILDQRRQVRGYELLFRNGPENFFPRDMDGTRASARIVHDSLHVFGLDAIAARHPIYVNVTKDALLRGLATLLPPSQTVVEILESVEPTSEVLFAVRALRSAGYQIALDDFVFREGFEPLIELADFIKVDFIQTKGDDRRRVVERFASGRRRLLAEKIESKEEFDLAISLGYSLFQGYFFCRPEMVSAKTIPQSKMGVLRILRSAASPSLNFAEVESLIKQELSLSVKLLRYLNSAVFGWVQEVSSIRRALTLLGERPFRKWVSVVALASLSGDAPDELVLMSLIRASFCERLASSARLEGREVELFFVGMLSLVDAILGRPMIEILEQLAVSTDVYQALVHRRGPLAGVYELAVAYERGQWDEVSALTARSEIPPESVPSAYSSAVEWANKINQIE